MWVMLGAMGAYTLYGTLGLPIAATMAILTVVLGVLGVVAERVSVFPFVRAGSDVWVMSTLAVGLLFINAAEILWGRHPLPVPPFLGKDPVTFAGVGLYPQEILIVAVACLVMVALDVFYQHTLSGKAFRAAAFSADMTSLMGINPRRMAMLAYALSGCLAGLAGLLVAPVTLAEPQMGTVLGLKAFAIAIIGGLEAGRGIFVCGLMYGMVETLLAGYLWTGIRDIIGFTLMILVLLIRPSGIFGRAAAERA
jgi:branched-chain amino acid transport system permease protein